jgi:hypothetical protein
VFDDLMGRIAGRFTRVEPRRRARAFVLGLLADLPRKNCWTIAEHAGDATPDGMQHLLAGARWDADGVRDDLRGYITTHLGDPDACWWSMKPGRPTHRVEPGQRRRVTNHGLWVGDYALIVTFMVVTVKSAGGLCRRMRRGRRTRVRPAVRSGLSRPHARA